LDPIPDGARVRRVASLDLLLQASDVVSLHCDLNPGTRGMIGARELALMRDGALLVNTARAELVDEGALADALRSGRLGGAALDVRSGEDDPDVDSALADVPGLLLTPHIAGRTRDSVARMGRMAVESVVAAMQGRIDE